MQHLANKARQDLDMSSGGDFRDDAAKGAVGVILSDHRLRKDLAIAADQRRSAVVAGRFQGKDQGHFAEAFA